MKGFENGQKNVLPDVVVRQRLIQLLEVRVVHVLEDERGRPADRVLDHALKKNHKSAVC